LKTALIERFVISLAVYPDLSMIKALISELAASKDTDIVYNQYLKKGIDLLCNITEFYSKADIH
jgi:hypothetical protein